MAHLIQPQAVDHRHRLERQLLQLAPFKRFSTIQRLGQDRSVIKVTTKPGLVYEQNLTNEFATLSTVNRELPDSRYFPRLWDHGRLTDGRVFLRPQDDPVEGCGPRRGQTLSIHAGHAGCARRLSGIDLAGAILGVRLASARR